MKKLLLTSVFLAGFAGTASATDWYILRGDSKQCMSAAAFANRPGMAAFASPAALEHLNREAGTHSTTEVKRDSDGKITMVFVESKGGNGIVYFPGKEACDLTRSASLRAGTLTDPGELK